MGADRQSIPCYGALKTQSSLQNVLIYVIGCTRTGRSLLFHPSIGRDSLTFPQRATDLFLRVPNTPQRVTGEALNDQPTSVLLLLKTLDNSSVLGQWIFKIHDIYSPFSMSNVNDAALSLAECEMSA